MVPSTMIALVTGKRSWLSIAYHGITARDIGHGVSVSNSVPTPKIGPSQVLVKVHTVGQNPTDIAAIQFLSPPHCIIGCDFFGEVIELGSAAGEQWHVGDRIAGTSHGGAHPDQGAYAEYLTAEVDGAWKVPTSISDLDAPTYGVSAMSAMQGLYHNLDVPWPDDPPSNESTRRTILIWAGSTCAGLFALQMAKHAGWHVVTTASPHSFDLVKRYGADAVFDYNSPSVIEDIKKAHPDITRAFDCIAKPFAVKLCAQVLEMNGGKLASLMPFASTKTPGIECIPIFAYTLSGKEVQWLPPFGPKWPAVPEDRAALVRFFKLMPSLVQWLRPPPVQVVPEGFGGLLDGLDMLRKGTVSGKKLVLKFERHYRQAV